MVDYVVRQLDSGKFGVHSSFNDAVLDKYSKQSEAIKAARERAWQSRNSGSDGESKAVVEYSPLKPDWA